MDLYTFVPTILFFYVIFFLFLFMMEIFFLPSIRTVFIVRENLYRDADKRLAEQKALHKRLLEKTQKLEALISNIYLYEKIRNMILNMKQTFLFLTLKFDGKGLLIRVKKAFLRIAAIVNSSIFVSFIRQQLGIAAIFIILTWRLEDKAIA